MDRLQSIAVFAQVARCGGLRAAARALGLSPATVSTRLSDLERQLGVVLLSRNTRGQSLTQEGRDYLAHCDRLLGEMAEIEERLRGGQREVRGRLTVSAAATIANHLLIPVLPSFFERHPGLVIDLDISRNAFRPAEEGGRANCDVMLRMGPFDDSSLVAHPLGPVEVVAVASPGYLRRAGAPKVPEDLREHCCIGIAIADTGRVAPWQLRSGARRLELDVSGTLVVGSGESRVHAARVGLGVTQAPRLQVQADLDAGRLVHVLPDWQGAAAPLFALHAGSRPPDRRIAAFVAYLAERFPPDRPITLKPLAAPAAASAGMEAKLP